ncbi:hypothetical protein [Luteimonas sp. A482]
MIATLLITLLVAGAPAEQPSEQPALQCNIGPAVKQFGGNDWLVYGCADGHSVVVTAGLPNPATPFVFIITPDGNGGIELHGEGTGAKSATKPAYDNLSTMSSSDLAELFQEARQANGQ